MKTLSTLFIITLFFSSFSSHATGKVEVLKTDQDKSSFLIKLDRELVGGTIDIVYSNGDVVTKEVLKRKKLLLDMSKVKEGEYTVIFNNGADTEDLKIIKDKNNVIQYGK